MILDGYRELRTKITDMFFQEVSSILANFEPLLDQIKQDRKREATRFNIFEALGVDYIDESEVLTPADSKFHVEKHKFKVPFVCGATDLGEALRRLNEGAAMIRTKGEAGTGNIIEAVKHIRTINDEVAVLKHGHLKRIAHECKVPIGLVEEIKKLGRLPVVNFAAGGIATPADAALCMQLGMDGVFVGSGIFKSDDPKTRAKAIVNATAHYNDAKIVAKSSEGLGEAMKGLEISKLDVKMQER